MDTLGNLDRLAVVVGIVVLIARQFRWRVADPRTLLRLPLALVGIGALTIAQEVFTGAALTARTVALLAAELALVGLLGATMGRLMQVRADAGRWRYRLSPRGIAFWALFVAIRVGYVRARRTARCAALGDDRGDPPLLRPQSAGERARRAAATGAADHRDTPRSGGRAARRSWGAVSGAGLWWGESDPALASAAARRGQRPPGQGISSCTRIIAERPRRAHRRFDR